MAKKGTTKKTTKTVDAIDAVETLDVPVVTVEEKLQSEIVENVTKEISNFSQKMEELQPSETFIETIMHSNPDKVDEIVTHEVKKIDNLKQEIQSKIDEIVNKNPEIVTVMKKAAPRFTNFWNGMEF